MIYGLPDRFEVDYPIDGSHLAFSREATGRCIQINEHFFVIGPVLPRGVFPNLEGVTVGVRQIAGPSVAVLTCSNSIRSHLVYPEYRNESLADAITNRVTELMKRTVAEYAQSSYR